MVYYKEWKKYISISMEWLTQFFIPFFDTDCGGMIEVPLGKDVFVTSPGYPVSYPIGKVCRWGVKVNELFL